jgi:hypothetical protein
MPAAGAGLAFAESWSEARNPLRIAKSSQDATMRIAILSDIHGNADALAAVLDDLSGRSVDATVVSATICPGRWRRAGPPTC